MSYGSSDVCSSELIRSQQAAPGLPAWRVRRVIGYRARCQQHFAMRFEIAQHLVSGIEIRFDLLGIVEIAEHRLQIVDCFGPAVVRSAEHTSELQSLTRISYAAFCLKKTSTNI